MRAYVLLLVLTPVLAQYSIKQPSFRFVPPSALLVAYPTEGGTVKSVTIHFNVNQPLSGVSAGQHVAFMNSPQGNEFVKDFNPINLSPGDKISYWINVVTDRGGYDKREQTFTIPLPTTTTTTTQAPQTRPPVTQATVTQGPPTQRPQTQNPGTGTQAPGVSTEAPATQAPATQTPGTQAPQTGGGGGNSGGSCTCKGKGDVAASCAAYPCLVLDEQFDTFNINLWEHEITAGGGGNWEFQYYINNRTNSYVRDGKLFLKPTLTSDKYGEAFLTSGNLDIWGTSPANLCTGPGWYGCSRQGSGSNLINPIQSARLRTVNTFSVKYGKVEVEAKLPNGDWIWPAIWMLPVKNAYGEWPASGEIDIMESRGNKNAHARDGSSIGVDHAGQTLHWGPYWPQNGYDKTTVQASGDFGDSFHKYGVEWTPDYIKFFLDGVETKHIDPGQKGFWDLGEFEKLKGDNPWAGSKNKMTPFDQEFYIVLNVAVGGTNGYFPDDARYTPHAKPWNNKSNQAFLEFWNARGAWLPTWKQDVNKGENAAMQINYVKVWKMAP